MKYSFNNPIPMIDISIAPWNYLVYNDSNNYPLFLKPIAIDSNLIYKYLPQ